MALFGNMNTDNIERQVLSMESICDEMLLRSEFDSLSTEMLEQLSTEKMIRKELEQISVAMVRDHRLADSNNLAVEELTEGYVELKRASVLLGIPLENSNLALEEYGEDINLSLEKLDGERKGLLDRAFKRLDNFYKGFTDLLERFKGLAGLLANYNIGKVEDLLSDINRGKYVAATKFKANQAAVNKKLAIFYAMGNKFDAKSLEEHLSIPYNLIVKDKLYSSTMKYVYDELIVSKFNEDEIPTHKESIDILDSLGVPEIKTWLNKDTKCGIMDRFLGHRFNIVSIYQDEHGADARSDMFVIPKRYYVNVDLKPLSFKDTVSILEFGKKLAKYGTPIGRESKKIFWSDFFKHLRSTAMTAVYSGVFGIFSIPRQLRLMYIAGEYYNGMCASLIMLHKSHLESADLIVNVAVGSLDKK